MIQEEFAKIVEYCFYPDPPKFVVRFLDGTSCLVAVHDLPKKYQTKRPAWDRARLSADKSTLLVRCGREIRRLPAHVIHSKGKEI